MTKNGARTLVALCAINLVLAGCDGQDDGTIPLVDETERIAYGSDMPCPLKDGKKSMIPRSCAGFLAAERDALQREVDRLKPFEQRAQDAEWRGKKLAGFISVLTSHYSATIRAAYKEPAMVAQQLKDRAERDGAPKRSLAEHCFDWKFSLGGACRRRRHARSRVLLRQPGSRGGGDQGRLPLRSGGDAGRELQRVPGPLGSALSSGAELESPWLELRARRLRRAGGGNGFRVRAFLVRARRLDSLTRVFFCLQKFLSYY